MGDRAIHSMLGEALTPKKLSYMKAIERKNVNTLITKDKATPGDVGCDEPVKESVAGLIAVQAEPLHGDIVCDVSARKLHVSNKRTMENERETHIVEKRAKYNDKYVVAIISHPGVSAYKRVVLRKSAISKSVWNEIRLLVTAQVPKYDLADFGHDDNSDNCDDDNDAIDGAVKAAIDKYNEDSDSEEDSEEKRVDKEHKNRVSLNTCKLVGIVYLVM